MLWPFASIKHQEDPDATWTPSRGEQDDAYSLEWDEPWTPDWPPEYPAGGRIDPARIFPPIL